MWYYLYKFKIKEVNMRNERGITLLSLVLTIVVMVILAGVAIYSGTIEDGGLINQVKDETSKQQEMVQDEKDKMNAVLKNQEEDWGIQ